MPRDTVLTITGMERMGGVGSQRGLAGEDCEERCGLLWSLNL